MGAPSRVRKHRRRNPQSECKTEEAAVERQDVVGGMGVVVERAVSQMEKSRIAAAALQHQLLAEERRLDRAETASQHSAMLEVMRALLQPSRSDPK